MYYKPYSSWSIKCQKLYPSKDVSSQGVQIYEITQSTTNVWIVSITMLVSWFISVIFLGNTKKCSETTARVFCLLSMLITLVLYIVAMVYYGFLLKDLSDISREHITSYVSN